MNESLEPNRKASQLKQLIFREDFTVTESDKCHPNGSGSLLDAGLSRHEKLLNARTAVRTVGRSKQRLVVEEALVPQALEYSVDADSAELSERRAGLIHEPSTVLVLVLS